MSKTQVKRPSQIDPLELELHYDLYECPHCVGGEAEVTYPDSDQVEWETCDQCGGEGQLAVRSIEFNTPIIFTEGAKKQLSEGEP